MSLHTLALPDHLIADLEREAEADAQLGAAQAVDRMIKAYEPKCELVWVGEKATTPGLVRCRWHVRYHDRDKGAMAAYIPWTGPHGEYREPDSSMVEWLRSMDLRGKDMVEEIRKARERRNRQAAAAREAAREEARDEFAGHAKALLNPGVSFSDARPWTNRVKSLPGA